MRREDFAFDLPEELIAQTPARTRTASRLLLVDGAGASAPVDRVFADLPGALRAGDLLVFNDTRVFPARLHGVKDSGGRVEVLVERIEAGGRVLAQIRASKSPGHATAARHGSLRALLKMVEREGPLPPQFPTGCAVSSGWSATVTSRCRLTSRAAA